MENLAGIGIVLGLLLILLCNIIFVFNLYCFIEEAFLVHPLWGTGIIVPATAGIILILLGRTIAVLFDLPIIQPISIICCVALLAASLVIGVAFAFQSWKKVKKQVAAILVSPFVVVLCYWVVDLTLFANTRA